MSILVSALVLTHAREAVCGVSLITAIWKRGQLLELLVSKLNPAISERKGGVSQALCAGRDRNFTLVRTEKGG